MSYINSVTLLGNMVRDPDLAYTPSGKAVCKFNLAVSNKFKGKDDKEIDKPLFIEIVVWNKQAEATAEYMTKGSPVLVMGRLTLDTWTDDHDKKHYKIKVVAQRVIFIGRKNDAKTADKENPGTDQPQNPTENQDEDIPF